MVEVGQIVRFAVPEDADEAKDRFLVLEDRGDRVLVRYLCDMSIPPTPVYLKTDLVLAD